MLAGGHFGDCPALYPLESQPGDEKDALTRLVTEIRVGWRTDGSDGGEEGWETRCLDLISEAREEHNVTRVERDGANERARMLLDAKNDIADDLRQNVAALEHDLAKTMDALLDTQRGMGEVRQQALREGRADVAKDLQRMAPSLNGLPKWIDNYCDALVDEE